MNENVVDFDTGKILNVNKPVGITSFQVVQKIKRRFNLKKAGHAGTLDPLASGVLLVLAEKATKKSEELAALEKEYIVEIELGMKTDTIDLEGNVIFRDQPVPEYHQGDIQTVLDQFVGEIDQVPPIYSALKYKGVPLYKYARKGQKVDIKPRKVAIYKNQLIEKNLPTIRFNVSCSKGTYIRSLVRDVGKEFGTEACLKSLVRTRVGNYHINDALILRDFLRTGAAKVDDESTETGK